MPGKCGRCGKNVYAAEERLGLNQSWHVRCFTCARCNRTLDSFTIAENREYNEIYCKNCYRLKFGTKGYGYGPNEPTLMALPSSCDLPERFFSEDVSENSCSCESRTKLPTTMPTPRPSRCVSRKVKPLSNKSSNICPPKFSWKPSVVEQGRSSQCPAVEKSRNCFKPTESPSEEIDPCLNLKSTRKADSVVSRKDRPCLQCDCGPLSSPRYPPKQPEAHRVPLTANSFKKDLSSAEDLSGKSFHRGCRTPTSTMNNNKPKPKRRSTCAPKKPLGGGEPCRRCQRPVYWAEMKLGYHGTYHQECFTCCCCGKPLESTTVSENQGEIFCKGCYRRLFGTHGYGYGIGAGTLQTS